MKSKKGKSKAAGKGDELDDDFFIFGGPEEGPDDDDFLIFGDQARVSGKNWTATAKIGRPTKWKDEYVGIARTLASEGFINEEIAEKIGVEPSTLYEWFKVYPAFSEAVLLGKEFANARVERAVYQRALGFTYEGEEIKVVSDGMHMGSSIERVPVTKYIPPDVTAQKFFLTNRKPKEWKERVDNTNIFEGTITVGYEGDDDE